MMKQKTLFDTCKSEPFLKWAGGKRQLLGQISDNFSPEFKQGKLTKYAEPFVGGGALLFHLARNYDFEEIFICDINKDLILAYQTICKSVLALIERLQEIEGYYLPLNTEERKDYYYRVRERFNDNLSRIDFSGFQLQWVERTAQLIFLNRTCFNGLFRVNSKGEFNVPAGRYKHPKICDAQNLKSVSQVLQQAEIRQGDFITCESFVDADTLVYFDPPYRPLNSTSHFTSYSKYSFDDAEQLRLAQFFRNLDAKGAQFMYAVGALENVSV